MHPLHSQSLDIAIKKKKNKKHLYRLAKSSSFQSLHQGKTPVLKTYSSTFLRIHPPWDLTTHHITSLHTSTTSVLCESSSVKPGEIVWSKNHLQRSEQARITIRSSSGKLIYVKWVTSHSSPWSQAVGPFDKKYCSSYPTERTNKEISIPITAKVQQPKVQASWQKFVAHWACGKLPKQTLTSRLPLFLWIISPARHFMKLWDNSCTMVFLRIVSRGKLA